MLVTYTPKGLLQTTVFRKPTHTAKYLPFSSHHLLQQKFSITPAHFSQAEDIIKENELKKDEIRTINNTLITNGFPTFHRKRRPARSESESQQTKIMTVIPTCRVSLNLLSVFCSKLVWGWLWSLYVSCLIFFVSPKTKFWTNKNRALLIKYLVVTAMQRMYIGETGPGLETRKRELIDALKNFELKKFALCQHVAENNHSIDWDNAKILRRECWHKRRIAEGYLIKQKSLELNVLNRNDGLIVPSVYQSLSAKNLF